MNVLITIEVNGFSQGTIVRPSVTEEIRLGLSHSFHSIPSVSLTSKGDLFKVVCPYSEEIEQFLFEAVCHIGELLRELAKEIHGWNVILHAADGISFDEMSRSLLFALSNNEGIVLSETAHKLLANTFQCRRQNSLWILTEQGIRLSVISEGICAILRREAVREAILDDLEPGINGSVCEPYILRVQGPRNAGKRFNVYAALEKIAGEQDNWWCSLFASTRDKSPLQPLRNSIDPSFLPDVEQYLSPIEKKVWEYRRSFPDFICPDQKNEDFLCSYELYLRAYVRKCRSNGLPPIMVIEDTYDFSQQTNELLNTVLMRLKQYEGLLPLIIEDTDLSGHTDVPLLRSDTERIVTVPAIGSEELRVTLGSLIHAHWIEEVIGATRGDPYFAYFMLLALDYEEEISSLKEGKDTCLQYVIAHIDYDTREYLYYRVLLDEVISPEVFQQFLTSKGYSNLVRYRDICVSIGVLDRRNRIYEPEILLELIERQDPVESKILRDEAFRFLFRAWRSNSICNVVLFLTLLYEYEQQSYAHEVFLATIDETLDRGQTTESELLLTDAEKAVAEYPMDFTEPSALRLALCRMRLGILRNDEEMTVHAYQSIRKYPYARELPEVLCALSEYQYADGDLESSLSYAKGAVMQSVDGRDSHIQCGANVHIGLVMLRRGRAEEAIEYFVMASDLVDRKTQTFDFMRAKTFEAIAFYLFGDQSRALESCSVAMISAGHIAHRSWEVFILFLSGRIYFEIGEYEIALTYFLKAMSMSRLYSMAPVLLVCRNWMIRARIYNEERLTKEEINSFDLTPESLYFLSEYYYFQGDFPAVCRLLDEAIRFLDSGSTSLLQGSEVIRWSSGYAFIEDLAYAPAIHHGERGSVITKLIKGFYALASYKRDGSIETVALLDELINEKRRGSQDPIDRILYLYRSRIVSEEPHSQSVSRMTILSKSLQNIQARASRNQSSTHRISYLHKNRWNKIILHEANTYHLL